MAALTPKEWKDIRKKIDSEEKLNQFKMSDAEREYVDSRGMDIIRLHTRDFVNKRLQPANPRNDGRQTPTKGHPVFIAQHATGTGSRKSMEEFHGIPVGVPLNDEQIEWVNEVILRWIEEETKA